MTSFSIDTKEIRKFGLIALIFFGCLCMLGIIYKKPVPVYLFGGLALLGFGFTVIPAQLKPVYAAWLKVAHFLGKINTAVILTLAYYLVLTPTALIKRISGGTPLPVKPDNKTTSYWVNRFVPAQPRERFSKRY
jgi:hypothetical protein